MNLIAIRRSRSASLAAKTSPIAPPPKWSRISNRRPSSPPMRSPRSTTDCAAEGHTPLTRATRARNESWKSEGELTSTSTADAAEAELRTDRSQPLSDMERLICAVSTARASRGATGSAENRRSAPVSLRQRVAPCVQGVAHMSWSGERSVSTSPRLPGRNGPVCISDHRYFLAAERSLAEEPASTRHPVVQPGQQSEQPRGNPHAGRIRSRRLRNRPAEILECDRRTGEDVLFADPACLCHGAQTFDEIVHVSVRVNSADARSGAHAPRRDGGDLSRQDARHARAVRRAGQGD